MHFYVKKYKINEYEVEDEGNTERRGICVWMI